MQNTELNLNYEIKCRANEISPLLNKIFSKIRKTLAENFDSETEINLEIAAREMLANAVEHGCTLSAEENNNLEDLKIKTTVEVSKAKIILTVKDPGPGFDWQSYNLEEMPEFEEKGRGLKMINKVADNIEFNQKGNIIRAFFKIKD